MRNVHYINAGAGAGKTTTLVNKLSEILQDPSNKPAEIILTTFTKAAAKEFREKTFKQLLKDGALQAAKSLDTATIGTVHSVAEQYIKRYWSLLGYSGQFNILTDVDKKKYINHSLDTFVDADDLAFFHQYALDFKLGKDGAEKWKKIIVAIISKANAYHIDFEEFENFSKQSCDVVARLFVHTFNMKTFQILAKDYVCFLTNSSKDVTNDGKPTSTAGSSQKKLGLYDDFVKMSSPTNDDYDNLIKNEFFKTSAKCDPSQVDSAENAKNYLDVCKILTFDNGDKVKDYIKRVFEIAEKWVQHYEDYKCKNNLLDFDDLEINFLKLLKHKDDAVRNDIQNSIKYVFVDEFQDSSPIQLEIFQELSDLVKQSYWVGDPKQAIYGFRGSDSSLTTNLLSSFPVPVPKQTSGFTPNSDGCTSQLIDTSYRSIESLVELANEVFDKSFANGVPSEIIRNVRLDVSRPDGNIQTSIQHWHCDNVKALATRVAEILNGAVSSIPGVYEENGTWRNEIHPSDIAVLCRTGSHCTSVANALREKGIPVATPETDILDNAEVKLVIALLKYVKCQRYAKAELSKLLENKEFKDILKDIANGRFNYDFGDEESKKTEEITKETTTPAPPVAVISRDLFEILDERLRNLRGLNISAIVKGIIAALDLYNVVAKWGKAATRRDNLNTLIKQAVAFEQSTASTTDSASISSFIKYLKNVEIDAQLDNGVEGVKVATYHKSKGLQWKIVILYSLDDDGLEISDFVEKEWCRLNLKTDEVTGKSELQLIPPIGNISKGVAEKVKELAGMPAGSDDNGYYNLRHGKVEGEIKRLLYVGVTRARDYLITVSLRGSKDNPSTPLSWMKNVIGSVSHSSLDTIADFPDKTPVELWGVKGYKSYYEKIVDDSGITYSGAKASYQKLKDKPINTETEPKCISPSSSQEKYDATADLVDGFSSHYIEHGTIKKGESAAFGTCIHNYFAAHRWEGTSNISAHEPDNILLAKQTVDNHNMTKKLPQPELLTRAADTLFSYLEKNYGAGELLRETPFTYRRDNGQLVQGEIDLIWKTDKECILLDYKNFPAPQDVGTNMVLNPSNDYYIGKYFPQLGDYRAALTAAGMKVTKVFVFYAVLGCLVEIQFQHNSI
ncbi:MAG: UvrD-helicase domain-containing protein [Bacteroidales bacterium]|nr:UvrD-helicase domain-containing protein [Bacteroidales bacterium]